ncbi:transporter substrate-binding domain-containing protein [Pseudomonas sp. N040]|nr:transporter substrate-binding domain-containing protein [Pseudomonas sp. N040]MBW7012325.1 transporter substrate-binding domain-containing protein [Pseudomonas sp. N040]
MLRASLCGSLLAACLLSASLHAERYLIGAEDDWYPYTALKDGESRGMSVDIVRAAFAATSADIQLVAYPYARCMQMALRGELVACFNTAPDARIADDYLLPATPLFRDDILLWARSAEATPLQDLGLLGGKRVAVTIGYEYGSRFDDDSSIVRVKVRKDLMGFLMLEHKRVDYFVAYRGTAAQLFHDEPGLAGKFTAVATVHQPQLFLSFSRHNRLAAEALNDFEQGMRIIHDNGRYQQILQQWQHNPAH